MKKLLIGVLLGLTLGLAAGFAIPAFARAPDDGAPPTDEAWTKMHEACQNGDWEAMAEAAQEWHGTSGSPPCQGNYTPDGGTGSTTGPGWGGMMSGGGGGMMGGGGGGMMGGGGGGMMGGWR